jgi:hypothetical protein
VSNLRLESVGLTPPSRLVLRHLDGRHDRAGLVKLVADWIEQAARDAASAQQAPQPAEDVRPPAERAAVYVDAVLKALARTALLVE